MSMIRIKRLYGGCVAMPFWPLWLVHAKWTTKDRHEMWAWGSAVANEAGRPKRAERKEHSLAERLQETFQVSYPMSRASLPTARSRSIFCFRRYARAPTDRPNAHRIP
ncbi:hypothetical protein DO72_5636 [Burkholderia pseudomallei]|nr:hypothetical protein DO72_5636 [Burkholderia pseudomallei]KGD51092.1 hypothetical protein DP43_5078 [Burkholderia pseudomallei]KGR97102.1 hypothetical protein X977_5416 [Burkholderia pseudomallei MSHR7504]